MSSDNKQNTNNSNSPNSPNSPHTIVNKSIDDFPSIPVFSCLLLLFIESFIGSLVIPFAGYMIEDFSLTANTTDIGYYAGGLGSIFFFGQFLSSSRWGALSDRIGRRKVLLTGLFSTTICTMIFGFSVDVYMAYAIRFVNGVMNGNFGVIRIYLKEICKQSEANQTRAFAYFAILWGSGALFGSICGGILARPVQQYGGSVFPTGSIWDKYPYLFVCMIASILCIIAFVIVFLYLEESLIIKAKPLISQTVPKSDEVEEEEESDNLETGNTANQNTLTISNSQNNGTNNQHSSDSKSVPLLTAAESSLNASLAKTQSNSLTATPTAWQLFLLPATFRISVCFFLLTFTASGNAEGFSVWALNSDDDEGIDFSAFETGLCFAIQAVGIILTNKFIFRRMMGKYPIQTIHTIGFIAGAIAMIIPPFTHNLYNSIPALWVVMSIAFLIRGFHQAVTFTTNSILLQKSLKSGTHAGAINGIVAGLSALIRSIGPISATALLALTLNKSYSVTGIFDYHLIFILSSICMLIAAIVSTYIKLD